MNINSDIKYFILNYILLFKSLIYKNTPNPSNFAFYKNQYRCNIELYMYYFQFRYTYIKNVLGLIIIIG